MDFDEAIVWAVDWSSYKPDEMAVVQRFRLAAGEQRPLIDAPGHVFNNDEADDCVGLFNLFVQYVWDAFMFIPKSQLVFFTHHHEIQFVTALSEEGRAEVKAILSRHQLSLCRDQLVDRG